MRISLAAAVNRDDILKQCLATSPDVVSGALHLSTYRNCANFGSFANCVLKTSSADWIVFVHQDAYLPRGFVGHIDKELARIVAIDPSCSIVGTIGLGENGLIAGKTWSSGMRRVLGDIKNLPCKAIALDEVLLAIRRSSGLRFDADMPGFHLYGTDIIAQAGQVGLSAWIAEVPIVHHSHRMIDLSGEFGVAWHFLQRKWAHRLPLPNLVTPVTRSRLPLLWNDFRVRFRARGARKRLAPTGDAQAIARDLGWEAEPDEA